MNRVGALKPGDTDTSCVQVSFAGTLTPHVRVYGTTGGTGLADYVNLQVTRGTGAAGFDDCSGLTADPTDWNGLGAGVVYSGTLTAFADDWAGGTVDPKAPAPWRPTRPGPRTPPTSTARPSGRPAGSPAAAPPRASSTGTGRRSTPLTSTTSRAKPRSPAECWLQRTTTDENSSHDVLHKNKYIDWNNQHGWDVGVTAANDADPTKRAKAWAMRHNVAAVAPLYSTTTINAGSWYHIVTTYDGATMRLYVNGALEGSVATAVSIVDTTEAFKVTEGSFDGAVDEVAIYGYALTGAQVGEHYAAGRRPGRRAGPAIVTVRAESPLQQGAAWQSRSAFAAWA